MIGRRPKGLRQFLFAKSYNKDTMIRTKEEYKEALSFIEKDLDLYDYDLSDKMSSLEYNVYLQDTQYYLNMLYEKMRSVEDMIEFLDYYTREKYRKLSEICDKAEQFISTMKDYNESDKRYDSAVSVEWDNDDLLAVYDRDGQPLKHGNIINDGPILPAYRVVESFSPESVTRTLSAEEMPLLPYSDNLDKAIESGMYKVAYETTNSELTSINDIIQFNFKETDIEKINSINYNLFDSRNIQVKISYISEKKAISMKLKLVNFVDTEESINIDSYTNSFLNKVNLENDTGFNTEKTVSKNIDRIRKLYESKNDKEYIQAIQEYQQARITQDKMLSRNGIR